MITIYYGVLVKETYCKSLPDKLWLGEIENLIHNFNTNPNDEYNVYYANELAIHIMRLKIKLGFISHQNVRFTCYDVNNELIYLYPDQNGRIERWPIGFCDFYDNIVEKLL